MRLWPRGYLAALLRNALLGVPGGDGDAFSNSGPGLVARRAFLRRAQATQSWLR
jgi:hypothetical protein